MLSIQFLCLEETMRFTKQFLLTGLAVLIAAGNTFAAGGQAQGSGGATQQKITIKVGDNWGASHPMAAALDTVFKPQIEQASGGAAILHLPNFCDNKA
jgi:hypothetical protein